MGKKTRRNQGFRPAGLGDTDDTTTVITKSNSNFADGLFRRRKDDSVLKTVVVYGAAAFGAYYGIKLLGNIVGKDLKTSHDNNVRDQIVTQADNGTDPTAIIAAALAKAINPEWSQNDPKVPPGTFTDANELDVFRYLAGPAHINWLGQIVVDQFHPIVNSAESLLGVSSKYLVLTGRTLDYDLRNNIGSWDYQTLVPYLNKIKCYHRKVDPKTKKITIVKSANCP